MYKIIDSSTIQRLSDGAFFSPIGIGQTATEYADWLAKGNTPEPAATPIMNDVIRAQIAAIEAQTGVSGIVREALLGTAQFIAQQTAEQMTEAGQPTTASDLLVQNIGYQSTLAVDNQIKTLEAQLT